MLIQFTLLLCPMGLMAQKEAVKREIELINQAYEQMTELRMEIEYMMYASQASTAKEIDRQKAILSRSGAAYHYQMGPVETLINTTYNIAADHEDKTLYIDKIRNRSERSEKQFGLDLNLALDACETVSISKTATGQKITLVIELPDIERAELYFEPKSHLMQKVVLYYREEEEWEEGQAPSKARLELHYRRQDTHPVFTKNLFDIARFVRKNKQGQFSPATRFQQYSFTNQTFVR